MGSRKGRGNSKISTQPKNLLYELFGGFKKFVDNSIKFSLKLLNNYKKILEISKICKKMIQLLMKSWNALECS